MDENMSVKITADSPIPLKYGGDTEVKGIPCTVSDMIDQGVIIADGRTSDEEVWEGAGIIISPTIPAGTMKTYDFSDPDLGPWDSRYKGQLIVDFTDDGRQKTAHIIITEAPQEETNMPITVAVSLNASSPCAIKWQPYNEDRYYLVMPGETVNATHNKKGSGRIWHSLHDPHAGDESDTFIKDLPGAAAYCAGSADTMGNSKYTGSVVWAYCDDGNPNTADITILTAPDIVARAPDALLHLVTVPTGAMAVVGGQQLGGTTDQIYRHSFPAGIYKERVPVIISLKHFKDKNFKKTLYAGLNEYALYILSTATKIKGTTKKSTAAGAASFTFTLYKKTGSKAQIVEAGMNLRLLNQANGQVKTLTTDALGVATITILYEDEFFASGTQKLVCILDNSADRIRTFKTITVSKIAGDSVGIDEGWHDENENESDDITATKDGRSVAIDTAYAQIGQ